MKRSAVLVPRVVLGDIDLLERRAQDLAQGDGLLRGDSSAALQVVTFRLAGQACAVDASLVHRAVLRLGSVVAVPLANGGARAVAFVEERPVAVADLSGFAVRAPRAAEALSGKPALVLTGSRGHVAVSVDGPLDLADDSIVANAHVGDGDCVRIAGRLACGASLLQSAWIVEWVRKAAEA